VDIAAIGGRCCGGDQKCVAVAGMRQRLPHSVGRSRVRSSASHSEYTSSRPSTGGTRRKRREGRGLDRFPLARTIHAKWRPWELKRGKSSIGREQLAIQTRWANFV